LGQHRKKTKVDVRILLFYRKLPRAVQHIPATAVPAAATPPAEAAIPQPKKIIDFFCPVWHTTIRGYGCSLCLFHAVLLGRAHCKLLPGGDYLCCPPFFVLFFMDSNMYINIIMLFHPFVKCFFWLILYEYSYKMVIMVTGGERLKFFRLFYDISQEDLADIFATTQRSIVLYETNKLKIKDAGLDLFCKITGSTVEYILQGKPPAFIMRSGFMSLPAQNVINLTLRSYRRKVSELKRNIHLLQNFLVENAFTQYALADAKESARLVFKIYIFISNTDNTLFFLKVYPDFFEDMDKNIISLLNIKQTSSAEISIHDVEMEFSIARDMFSYSFKDIRFVPSITFEDFWLVPTIRRLLNSLSIPESDDIINTLRADACYYANVIEPQIQKAWEKVKEIKIKQIAAIMREYGIALTDMEKYLSTHEQK
jgi:transcriptional regulator with XRE-family HTH domain